MRIVTMDEHGLNALALVAPLALTTGCGLAFQSKLKAARAQLQDTKSAFEKLQGMLKGKDVNDKRQSAKLIAVVEEIAGVKCDIANALEKLGKGLKLDKSRGDGKSEGEVEMPANRLNTVSNKKKELSEQALGEELLSLIENTDDGEFNTVYLNVDESSVSEHVIAPSLGEATKSKVETEGDVNINEKSKRVPVRRGKRKSKQTKAPEDSSKSDPLQLHEREVSKENAATNTKTLGRTVLPEERGTKETKMTPEVRELVHRAIELNSRATSCEVSLAPSVIHDFSRFIYDLCTEKSSDGLQNIVDQIEKAFEALAHRFTGTDLYYADINPLLSLIESLDDFWHYKPLFHPNFRRILLWIGMTLTTMNGWKKLHSSLQLVLENLQLTLNERFKIILRISSAAHTATSPEHQAHSTVAIRCAIFWVEEFPCEFWAAIQNRKEVLKLRGDIEQISKAVTTESTQIYERLLTRLDAVLNSSSKSSVFLQPRNIDGVKESTKYIFAQDVGAMGPNDAKAACLAALNLATLLRDLRPSKQNDRIFELLGLTEKALQLVLPSPYFRNYGMALVSLVVEMQPWIVNHPNCRSGLTRLFRCFRSCLWQMPYNKRTKKIYSTWTEVCTCLSKMVTICERG